MSWWEWRRGKTNREEIKRNDALKGNDAWNTVFTFRVYAAYSIFQKMSDDSNVKILLRLVEERKSGLPFQLSGASVHRRVLCSYLWISHWLQQCHWKLQLKPACWMLSWPAEATWQHLQLIKNWVTEARSRNKVKTSINTITYR